MLYKIENITTLAAVENCLPHQVCKSAYQIVSILDREYGAGRDVDQDDGGFVLIAETVEDVQYIQRRYQDMDGVSPEEVNILQSERPYISALYLKNNEFGITVMLPLDLAPERLQQEVIPNGDV